MLDKKLVERVEEPTGRFVITCLHCGNTWKSINPNGGGKAMCIECGKRINKDLRGEDYAVEPEMVEGRCWVERYDWRYKNNHMPLGVQPILKRGRRDRLIDAALGHEKEDEPVPFPCRFQAFHQGRIGTFDFITDAAAAVKARKALMKKNQEIRERECYDSIETD